MPRKPRIEYEGAFYHVIVRGNQRQKIFKEPADYDKYHQILTIYRNRYRFRLYAFVFMSNHVHLLLETGETPLSKALQGVNQSYTLYFNRKYHTVGHLFQGRYKAILCDRETYLLGLLKYIHENPVRAKISDSVEKYKWSSHHAYTGRSNPLDLVSADQVLRLFSESKGRARRKYLEFMKGSESMEKSAVYATIDQRLQGDDTFVESVAARVDGGVKKEPRRKAYPLARISGLVQLRYSVAIEDLRSSGKASGLMIARRAFARTAKRYGYQGREIAAYLRKDPASVTGYLQGEKGRKESEELVALLERKDKNVNSKV